MHAKRGFVLGMLAGIASLLNANRKTQSWGIVVFEEGEVREI